MRQVFFAPMEGITDAVFRRVHHECFSGVTAYFIPFISPTQHLVLTNRQKKNLLPEYCPGVPCVPQVLTKEESHFLWAANVLRDMGYDEVNLNAGCPSGTVTAKGKGAGILRDVKQLDYFLEDVCAQSPVPVSVKTRIGFESPDEWQELLQIYAQYPLKRLIVHPRTCRERYAPGQIHPECLDMVRQLFQGQIIINGDLFTRQEVDALPCGEGVMLGRGLVANPAMARVLAGGDPLRKEELIHYHDRMLQQLEALYQPDIVFMKLRVVMKHLACCFADTGKIERQIRKSRKLQELLAWDQRLFDTCELKQEPAFVPDELRAGEV